MTTSEKKQVFPNLKEIVQTASELSEQVARTEEGSWAMYTLSVIVTTGAFDFQKKVPQNS